MRFLWIILRGPYSTVTPYATKSSSSLLLANKNYTVYRLEGLDSEVNHLLDDDSLGLLFWRSLGECDRQDAILHLGRYVFGLASDISIHRLEGEDTSLPWSRREAATCGRISRSGAHERRSSSLLQCPNQSTLQRPSDGSAEHRWRCLPA